ncbi:MAG: hypothetical protein HeimC2_35520 [Candidatus Heimdallarchaeota archaeon LC_2]|nr:MAG: hypothetical protein HeimC2_35520 [Candidatus Heimdallarchaeota archaeon LC_2]
MSDSSIEPVQEAPEQPEQEPTPPVLDIRKYTRDEIFDAWKNFLFDEIVRVNDLRFDLERLIFSKEEKDHSILIDQIKIDYINRLDWHRYIIESNINVNSFLTIALSIHKKKKISINAKDDYLMVEETHVAGDDSIQFQADESTTQVVKNVQKHFKKEMDENEQILTQRVINLTNAIERYAEHAKDTRNQRISIIALFVSLSAWATLLL